ncbi:MAG TPA: hypothetical protein VFB72_11990, partial [Verrucomicrobiae bacterium]|nr:hypothetical protein [Verrucomicrobiae bacterium]
MKPSTLIRNFGLIAIFAVLDLAEKSAAQTLISLTNYTVTTPGSQFKFNVNNVDSGKTAQDANVDDSVDFSLNAGATYIFSMSTSTIHPVDIDTAPNTTTHYSGASVQSAASGTIVKLTIPATNYPS